MQLSFSVTTLERPTAEAATNDLALLTRNGATVSDEPWTRKPSHLTRPENGGGTFFEEGTSTPVTPPQTALGRALVAFGTLQDEAERMLAAYLAGRQPVGMFFDSNMVDGHPYLEINNN